MSVRGVEVDIREIVRMAVRVLYVNSKMVAIREQYECGCICGHLYIQTVQYSVGVVRA